MLPLPQPGDPPRPRVPRPERLEFSSGLRTLVFRRPDLPRVVLKLVLPAGAAAEQAERVGTAALVGRLMTEGTERYPPELLNARLDSLGAALDVHVSHDFAEVELFALAETLPDALPLLAEVVSRATFPADQVERLREEALDELEARGDAPGTVADDRIAAELFGADHPYGRPTIGTEASVSGLERDELKRFYQRFYRPDRCFLIAAGDLDASFPELLERDLSEWTGRAADRVAPDTPDLPRSAGARIDVAWPDAAQAEIRVGGLGLPRSSGDWIAAAVANYILGGSVVTGRLGANLREAKGWTYGARSGFAAATQPGGWVAEAAVDVRVRDAALQEMLGEIRRMLEEPVEATELRRAQDALVLSLPRAFETAGRVVNRFVTIAAFSLEQDYWERFDQAVRAVTRDDVLAVAQRYFAPDRLVQVIVA